MEALLGRAAARIWHEATFSQREQERQQQLQHINYQPPAAPAPEQATLSAAKPPQAAKQAPINSPSAVAPAAPGAASEALASGADELGSAKTRWLSRSRVTADDILAKPAQAALFPGTQQHQAAAPSSAAAAPGGSRQHFTAVVRTGSEASNISHTSLPAISEAGPGRKSAAGMPMPSRLPLASLAGQGALLPPAASAADDREVTKAVLAELGQSDPANVSWQLLAEISRRADLAELLADVKQAALGRSGRVRRLNGKQCRRITHALNRRLLGGASRPGLTGSGTTKLHHQHHHHLQQHSQLCHQQKDSEEGMPPPRRSSCAESGINGGGTTEDEEDARTEVSSEWKSSVADLSEFQDSVSMASLGTAGSVADCYGGGSEEWAEEGPGEGKGGRRLCTANQ